jgi:hypothetical protein
MVAVSDAAIDRASAEILGSFPSMRNLLGTASVAQSLDGNRLTGSLRIPEEDESKCGSPWAASVANHNPVKTAWNFAG